jgi:predicted dehydrogenase
MEALKSPFFPLYRKLREHLSADPIGPIGFVRAGHSDATRDPKTYPTYNRDLGGGSLLGIGPYPAFLALDWLGPLKSVHAVGRVGVQGGVGAGVDVLALVNTQHERGFAQLHTGLELSSEGDALISGTIGYVKLHANWWSPHAATVVYADGRRVELVESFVAGGFNYETEHFCDLIRAGARESEVSSHMHYPPPPPVMIFHTIDCARARESEASGHLPHLPPPPVMMFIAIDCAGVKESEASGHLPYRPRSPFWALDSFVDGSSSHTHTHTYTHTHTHQVISHEMSLGMAKLIEDARRSLGVRYPGEDDVS